MAHMREAQGHLFQRTRQRTRLRANSVACHRQGHQWPWSLSSGAAEDIQRLRVWTQPIPRVFTLFTLTKRVCSLCLTLITSHDSNLGPQTAVGSGPLPLGVLASGTSRSVHRSLVLVRRNETTGTALVFRPAKGCFKCSGNSPIPQKSFGNSNMI